MTQPNPEPNPGSTPPQRHDEGSRAPQTAQQLAQRDAGLIAFIENLRYAQEQAENDRRKFAGLARQTAEEQPAHPSVAEGMQSMAEMYGAAANLVGGIYPAARQRHRDDYERGEQPRRGRTQVESRADARQTYRDGAV